MGDYGFFRSNTSHGGGSNIPTPSPFNTGGYHSNHMDMNRGYDQMSHNAFDRSMAYPSGNQSLGAHAFGGGPAPGPWDTNRFDSRPHGDGGRFNMMQEYRAPRYDMAARRRSPPRRDYRVREPRRDHRDSRRERSRSRDRSKDHRKEERKTRDSKEADKTKEKEPKSDEKADKKETEQEDPTRVKSPDRPVEEEEDEVLEEVHEVEEKKKEASAKAKPDDRETEAKNEASVIKEATHDDVHHFHLRRRRDDEKDKRLEKGDRPLRRDDRDRDRDSRESRYRDNDRDQGRTFPSKPRRSDNWVDVYQRNVNTLKSVAPSPYNRPAPFVEPFARGGPVSGMGMGGPGMGGGQYPANPAPFANQMAPAPATYGMPPQQPARDIGLEMAMKRALEEEKRELEFERMRVREKERLLEETAKGLIHLHATAGQAQATQMEGGASGGLPPPGGVLPGQDGDDGQDKEWSAPADGSEKTTKLIDPNEFIEPFEGWGPSKGGEAKVDVPEHVCDGDGVGVPKKRKTLLSEPPQPVPPPVAIPGLGGGFARQPTAATETGGFFSTHTPASVKPQIFTSKDREREEAATRASSIQPPYKPGLLPRPAPGAAGAGGMPPSAAAAGGGGGGGGFFNQGGSSAFDREAELIRKERELLERERMLLERERERGRGGAPMGGDSAGMGYGSHDVDRRGPASFGNGGGYGNGNGGGRW